MYKRTKTFCTMLCADNLLLLVGKHYTTSSLIIFLERCTPSCCILLLVVILVKLMVMVQTPEEQNINEGSRRFEEISRFFFIISFKQQKTFCGSNVLPAW